MKASIKLPGTIPSAPFHAGTTRPSLFVHADPRMPQQAAVHIKNLVIRV